MMGSAAVRDWPATLPKASFKGVRFHVEREGVDEGGRFVAVHPFVNAENHATEDLGRKPQLIGVTAYVVGNLADARAQELLDACSSYGEGLLVLPMTGALLARCVSVSTASEKGRLGYVALSMRFVEAGLDTGGFPLIEIGDRIAEDILKTLPGLIGDVLSGF
ncbi:MAG: hypothetical protein DI565_13900 [Ancylobacter novellus]|uniref:DNA circulation N-terminal domain-containing protein n=1 Tax=Ancylobacter novellus TaxID=921 RepID=A0A2W5K9S3_ANCNO|nr:MAG: hypothetical protein DI565_13900 [Ancylobacter novellus]